MKKNVLLVTSAAPLQSPFSTSEKRPPIGIGFLISVLRNGGHEVFFIDNYLNPSPFLETDYLRRNRIEYVGIYANTICFRDTLRMLHRLEYLRQCGEWRGKIMVGGPHTTVALETIPDFVDFVVQGEGEKALLDIVEDRVKQRVVSYPRIHSLDDLPMPAWDYFVHLDYNWGLEWFTEKPVFTMNTSRGCPFHCTFCSVGSIWGKKYTFCSAQRIVSDIEHLAERYGAKGIYFREDNFTCDKERLNRFCLLMIERKIKFPWACETRANALDRETVALMHQAGARAFYIGVESGSQRMLDFFKKGVTLEQIRNAFAYCREFDIKTGASIIIGAPTETEEDLKRTFELIEEIQPTVTWPNVFVGIPNSELYQYAVLNKLHEFIDDRGLVYLKGHNDRSKKFYGNRWNAALPVNLHHPKISVVMSTYNHRCYLPLAVSSILKQTFQDFELIIIDDASTDATADILSKLDDPRLRIFRNSQNLGLTKSLNTGIQHARGKYIARMDADDLSCPHRLETQVRFLDRNPEYALVGSSYYTMDETGKINGLIRVLEDNQSIQAGLKEQNWFGHGSVMMRSDAFQRVGGYDEKFKFAQDYDLWLRMASVYKVANIGEPLYCWRVTGSSITTSRAEEQQYYATLAVSEAQKREGGMIEAPKVGPMVSVIVPTHNRPEMLVETIRSILNQTYPHAEIIVVNDAGADVENLVSSLNQKGNITYVKHDRNRGLAAARNTGIRLARGKYIAYHDDDDLYYPDHLETLVNFLEKNDYKVAYTDAYRAHQEIKNGKYIVTKRDVPYSHDFDYDKILVTNFVPVLCFVHEKSCLDEVGLFDESLKRLEDWDMWIRLSRKFKFAHIKKITCEFNWRLDGSTMTSGKASEFTEARKAISRKYSEYLNCTSGPLSGITLPAMKKGVVSIVVLTFNQLRYTKECVESIRVHTPEPHEIIFVDNGSTDGTVKWLRGLVKKNENYRLIENGKNLGFAKGCNQGINASTGKSVLLLNNDVIVTEGWLSGMLRCLKSGPEVGIVGPMTNSISGPQKVPTADYPSVDHLEEFARAFRERNRGRRINVKRVVGFCMLFKRELVEQIGLLDEEFGSGNFEDDDFCLRATLKGFQNLIAGDVFIHHYGSRSFIGNKIDYADALSRNRKIFQKKWGVPNTQGPVGNRFLLVHTMDKADEYNQKDEIKKALTALYEGIGLFPGERGLYEMLIDLLIDAKQFQEALAVLDQMPSREADPWKLERVGYCKEGLGRPEEAKAIANLILSLQPNSPYAWNLKGMVAYRDGNKEESERFFKKAITLDPGYGESHTNLGVLKWALDQKEEALNFLERGVVLSPTATDGITLYHQAITATQSFERAERTFREANALYPLNRRIAFLLIDVLIQQGKDEAALSEIEKAMIHFGVDDGILTAAVEVRNRLGLTEIAPTSRGTLSLCMIVKNEEENLPGCLLSVKPVVDEMIVVDTGSTDKTREIARVFGAKVFDHEWADDFSEARNFSLSKAKGSWILILDADEVISPADYNLLIQIVKEKKAPSIAYSLTTRNYVEPINISGWTANDGRYREEAGTGWFPGTKVRLFPHDPRIYFEHPVHELVEPSLRKAGIRIKDCPVPVHHYGKLSMERNQTKGEEYFLLGKRKLEGKGGNFQSLYELAVQAGELGRYGEAVELWQRCIDFRPEHPKAHFNLGYAYLKLGRFEEALIASARAMELDPGFKEAVFNYSLCEFCAGEIHQAISALEGLVIKEPGYPSAISLLSAAYLLKGDREKGMETLARMKSLGYDAAVTLHSFAERLISAGRRDAAVLLMERAVEAQAVNGQIISLLAHCKNAGQKDIHSFLQP